MVQAAPDVTGPDGHSGRTIWEGTTFSLGGGGIEEGEGRGRGREGRELEMGREGERKRQRREAETEKGWNPASCSLANSPSPLQTPRCGRRST